MFIKSHILLIINVLNVLLQSVEGFSRIIGGEQVPVNSYRYHASLQNLTGYHVCGGAVISPRHVITAAHCLLGASPEYVNIVVGTTNLDEGGEQYGVEEIMIHNGYNLTLRLNDIAIIKIKESFNSPDVQILNLHREDLKENDPVLLTGFGALQRNGTTSRLMHALWLKVFSQNTCKYAMRHTREVYDSMVCTFSKIGEGTCYGDSGGPLVTDDKLAGLVSWGIPCAMGFPDVHTRVNNFIDWIEERITN